MARQLGLSQAHPRFRTHLTPTGASWLNLVERWFAELTNKRIRRGEHRPVQALEKDIRYRGRAGGAVPGVVRESGAGTAIQAPAKLAGGRALGGQRDDHLIGQPGRGPLGDEPTACREAGR
ncbi:hypothetical protein HS041_26665 [Planomonospora sp. ID67723]|nr:hypothetical protein [Planomonospora sp. ID67723]MBG0831333.1 hypothetical protein [Planomonospora sp. ID67723]